MSRTSESKGELIRSRERLMEMIDDLQENLITRCIIHGCVYGYKGVHEMPTLECIYCKTNKDSLAKRGVKVKLNDWTSPGMTVEELIAQQKKKKEESGV